MKIWAEAAWKNQRLSLAEALEISDPSSKTMVIDARIGRALQFLLFPSPNHSCIISALTSLYIAQSIEHLIGCFSFFHARAVRYYVAIYKHLVAYFLFSISTLLSESTKTNRIQLASIFCTKNKRPNSIWNEFLLYFLILFLYTSA